MSDRAEGHYWTQWGTNPHWDVLYWRDGYFWDASDCGYNEENFTVGHQVFPPDHVVPVDHDDWDFQQRVGGWMQECFTPEIIADKLERNDRFIEEALELVQSLSYSAERAHALVDYVFGRPKGDASQEVGGVMVTLAALCNPNGLDMEMAAETELARILDPAIVLKIRDKQASKPTGSALPVPTEADGTKPS